MRHSIAIPLVVLACLAWGAPARALTLDDLTRTTIKGATADSAAGAPVANAGDVNRDGVPDYVVGAFNEHAAYVVFGRPGGGTVDLGNLGSGGFRISGLTDTGDFLVRFADGAGDFNADGRPDIVLGDLGKSRVYVVFGKASNAPVDLNNLGSGGVVINNVPLGILGTGVFRDHFQVAGAGDVNHDGFADIVVGAANTNRYDSNGH